MVSVVKIISNAAGVHQRKRKKKKQRREKGDGRGDGGDVAAPTQKHVGGKRRHTAKLKIAWKDSWGLQQPGCTSKREGVGVGVRREAVEEETAPELQGGGRKRAKQQSTTLAAQQR
jgi:hypothetical protein